MDMRRTNGSAIEGSRKRVPSFIAAALSLLIGALAAAPAGARQVDGMRQGEKTQVKQAAAKVAAGTVKVSGWATFSGQMMGSADDPKDDAIPSGTTDTLGTEALGSDFIYRPENEDFFWRLELAKIPVTAGGLAGGAGVGFPTTLYVLPFTAKGESFEIRVQSLGVQLPDPENPEVPNAGAVFGLFKCDGEGVCTEVAKLKGGYGTTGERIVVALPLNVLKEKGGANVQEGDKIGGLTALIATAQYQVGIQDDGEIHDSVSMIKTADADIPVKSVTVTVGKKSMKLSDGNGLKEGYFNAEFPASAFKKSGPTTVKTRTCLGKDCVNQSFKMTP